MSELSLIKFFEKFPNEEKATEYFESLRWKDGIIVCPYCGSIHISRCKVPMPYRCRDCRKHFSVRIGTVLNESKLPLLKWLLAIYVLTNSKKGVSSVQLAEYLGVTQKTAWFLAHRIRETWEQGNKRLEGTVEVDETYIGGKNKNRHVDKKVANSQGGNRKCPVIGLKSRSGGVKSFVIKETDTHTLTTKIRVNIKPWSNVYTDEYSAYKDLYEYNHQKVNHSAGEYTNNDVYTNGIESFWAVLKRGYYGIYHQWSFKHLQRYVNEFALRHNIQDDIERLSYTILSGIGKKLSYKELICG